MKELRASWEARVKQLETELERSEVNLLTNTQRLEAELR